MNRVKDINSLYDFIGYVVLCAPDDFPQRDYLSDEEQMNLDRAFDELKKGIDVVTNDSDKTIAATKQLTELLAQSLSLYRDGNNVAAAHKLQEFQDAIYKS